MGRRLRIAIAWAVIGATAGCGAQLPHGVQLTEGFAVPGTLYGDVLARHTRYAELYQGFDTVAKGWATRETPDLRAALAEASVHAYRLEGAAAEAVREEARTLARGGREFHLALYTPKKQWNDLESPGSLWRVRLELPDDSPLEPASITSLSKTDKSPVQYPYVSPWTREYRILFPAQEDATARPLSLVLTGPLGTLRFAF